jgi:hypothetical protein
MQRHGSTDADSPVDDPSNYTSLYLPNNNTYVHLSKSHASNTTHSQPKHDPQPTFYDLLLDPQTSSLINLLFTYLFTLLTLHFLELNYHRFIQSRQGFSLHLIHSVAARTVLVTNLPSHLRGDKALAEYFEGCGWDVESVSVCRQVEGLRVILEKRTIALLGLERAWAEWVGNPAKVRGYDPDLYTTKRSNRSRSPEEDVDGDSTTGTLIPGLDDGGTNGDDADTNGDSASRSNSVTIDLTTDPEDPCLSRHNIHTNRPRPTFRPNIFGTAVDAIEYWEKEFSVADEEVKRLRRQGMFDATDVAFVTFEDMKDAVRRMNHVGFG